MAFVDEVSIQAAAGKGGDGVVRWLHVKSVDKAGPSGGDGGKGGDAILVGVRDLAALSHYRYEKKFRAEDGSAGDVRERTGKDGNSVEMRVPVGTVATVAETGETFEITEEGVPVVVFKGGYGGRGNAHYKSSTNQNPEQSTKGRAGEAGTLHLTLKIIADAGLIGLPNAGKSSLLNALTRARSKVGAYAFTTLEPNLGDFYGFILADIPGLIEGASAGRGLGVKFLKHIERTKMLIHLVSADQDDPVAAYREVRKELAAFGHGLTEKAELVILSKIDLVSPEDRETKRDALTEESGREVVTMSVEDPLLIKEFADQLSKELAA